MENKRFSVKTCCFLAVALLLLTSHCADSRPQFWSRFRDVVLGRPGSSNSDNNSGRPYPSDSQQPSKCDKGESYSPDKCNKCVCVGESYRCTLKYCDESLANLPAFQFD